MGISTLVSLKCSYTYLQVSSGILSITYLIWYLFIGSIKWPMEQNNSRLRSCSNPLWSYRIKTHLIRWEKGYENTWKKCTVHA